MMGSGWHPKYRAVIEKRLSLGYNLPSFPNMLLENEAVINLHTPVNFWSSLDWLYFFGNDAADNNAGRLNFINPNEVVTGSPTFTSKKGWTGNASFGHSIPTGPNWVIGDCLMFFYSTVGGTVTAPETIQGQTGANGQIATMRHRLSAARIDFIMNATIAGPSNFPAGAATNNTYYAVDNDNTVSGNLTMWKDSALVSTIAASSGAIPDTSQLGMGITSPRITGIVGGGRSIHRWNGGAAAHPALNTILQQYMAGVQALP
jgi:hypothetical protein